MSLRPDRDHPVSKGFACQKGLLFHQVHHRPDRLGTPSLDGAPVSWEAALGAIGARLRGILDAHGPEAVGLYSGNAAGHSLGGILGVAALQDGLGTTKHYSCLTLDNSPQFVVIEACLGNPMLTFVADYAQSDCVVLVGTDPLSSQPSQSQSHPQGTGELLAVARAGNLVVVDPRRSLTASRASLHLAPRPGTDVLLLAHLLGAALDAGRGDESVLREGDRAALSEALRGRLSPTALAERLDVPLDALQGLVDRLLAAERPLVWSGLGVLLGAHGTVGYWLTLALQAVLGRLDRVGGWWLQPGAVDVPALFARLGRRGRDRDVRSRIGDYPAILGTVAAATLAEDILTPGPGQLRALIVLGGNPVVSLPDTARAREALSALELLVSVDLFVNETGALADAVLPACSWLARGEVPVHTAHQRRVAHVDDVQAVVRPVGEARPDFRICCDLARAAGVRPFGHRVVDWGLRASGVEPATLGRVALRLSPARAPRLRDRGTDHPDGRVHLAVPELLEALPAALSPTSHPRFALVTSVRPVDTMNGWLRVGRGGRRRPVARLHPADHAALGRPAKVRLTRPGAGGDGLVVEACPDEAVRTGVVVVPFGWDAVPVNLLVGTTRLESFTGQPVSNGVPVEVSAVLPEPG